MDLGLTDRRALVMGGSAGIGKGIAAALAAEGARVAVCARTEHKLKKAAAEVGAKTWFVADLLHPGAGEAAVREAVDLLGGVDVLVINTGGPPAGTFMDITPAMWLDGFNSLWISAVDAIREALPAMREQKWGRILFVTSIAAEEPLPALTVSNGLRAGLHGLINSLSKEVASEGVTVNALMPGWTRTERLAELETNLVSQIPAGRLADPAEMGSLAAFMVSDRASYLTGQAIALDGGFLRGI